MERIEFELIINTLQQYKILDIVINELGNIRTYKKYKELLNNQISEIEKVAYNLEQLEKDIYYQYLKNETERNDHHVSS